MKKTIFTLAAVLMTNVWVHAQYSVKHLDGNSEPPVASLAYCLPQNAFRIEVEWEKNIQERGIFADYAEPMLKIPAVKNDAALYRIHRIKIHTTSLPDPTQVYALEGSALPDICLLPEGILLGVNLDKEVPARHRPENGPRPDHTASGPKQETASGQHSGQHPSKPHPAHRHQPVAMPNSGGGFDTLITTRVLDSITVVEKVLKPRVASKELYEQARKAADQIREIQKTQANLLAGLQEVPYPEGTFKFMMEQLQENERNLLECFIGSTRSEIIRQEFIVMPEEDKTEYFLTLISGSDGEKELSLTLTPLTLPALQTTSDPKNYKEPEPDPKAAKKGEVKPIDRGFVYRIPAKVRAEITLDGETVESRDTFISQWGSLQQLPALPGYSMEFDPKTGALKSLRNPNR